MEKKDSEPPDNQIQNGSPKKILKKFARKVVIIDDNEQLDLYLATLGVDIVHASDYLASWYFETNEKVKVYNLCKSYRYQNTWYYVSLLAEARGHIVIPSVLSIQDFKSQSLIRLMGDDIDELIQKSLSKIKSTQFELSVYFGQNIAKQHEKLSQTLFSLFQVPFLKINFTHNGKKRILQNVSPLSLKDISFSEKQSVVEAARDYFASHIDHNSRIKSSKSLYDLAILINEEEKEPPSNKKALQKFADAAEKIWFDVDFITKDDFNRLLQYDALFIRETTFVNHHTYRFARKAQSSGMVVIDDPLSILRCTNKIYLNESFKKNNILLPKTTIISVKNFVEIGETITYPCVLKEPDSAFSKGVIKITTKQHFFESVKKMLKISDMIIVQEFIPTEFDWRIGVMDKRPLFACKYYMAKGHWQIYNWTKKTKKNKEWAGENVPLRQVPTYVIETALKSAKVIGDGLYGVDIKEIDGKAYVIEVNDNPNIDEWMEDILLKDELYLKIMESFFNRIEKERKV